MTCRLCMHNKPPITIILDQFINQPKQALPPLVVDRNLKMSEEQKKNISCTELFWLEDDVDQKQVRCRRCALQCTTRGNTTNLFDHLKLCMTSAKPDLNAIQSKKLFRMPLPVLHHMRTVPNRREKSLMR